jgi:hypothetical protein
VLTDINDHFKELFTANWEKRSQIADLFEILNQYQSNNCLVEEWTRKYYKIISSEIVRLYVDTLLRSKNTKLTTDSITIIEEDFDIMKDFFGTFYDLDEFKIMALPINFILRLLNSFNKFDQKDSTSFSSDFIVELSEFLLEIIFFKFQKGCCKTNSKFLYIFRKRNKKNIK